MRFELVKTEDCKMLVLMSSSCNLHNNQFFTVIGCRILSFFLGFDRRLGLDRKVGLADLFWFCQDLLILPDVLNLIPGSTMMFLVLGMIDI